MAGVIPLTVPLNEVVLVTTKLPITVFPPTYKFPPIPAPPDTMSAPDAVLIDTVVLLLIDATLVCLKFGLSYNRLPDTLAIVVDIPVASDPVPSGFLLIANVVLTVPDDGLDVALDPFVITVY